VSVRYEESAAIFGDGLNSSHLIMKTYGVFLQAILAEATDYKDVGVRASPVVYISRDMPPFLLMHGSKDEDVPYEQSVEMCDKMKKVGVRCDLVTIEGAPHGMDHWETHPEFLWYKKALIDRLQKNLR